MSKEEVMPKSRELTLDEALDILTPKEFEDGIVTLMLNEPLELRNLIRSQAAEIERLKAEKVAQITYKVNELSFEQIHYEKLLDEKRFQVAKDLFCSDFPDETYNDEQIAKRAKACNALADIFMAEFLKPKGE